MGIERNGRFSSQFVLVTTGLTRGFLSNFGTGGKRGVESDGTTIPAFFQIYTLVTELLYIPTT